MRTKQSGNLGIEAAARQQGATAEGEGQVGKEVRIEVSGDVDNPKSFIRKDARIVYASLCQGHIGREKSDEGRAVSWKGERHTRLLVHLQLQTQSQVEIRQLPH
jgi:hypothetical protein